ncbi:MAG: hypothetical protein WCI94_01150 [Rhodospirillales bacterium]
MSSSISSSDPWRRFFRLLAGTVAVAAGVVYAFVVLVDPFDVLPLSLPADRPPVASNQRYAYPSLARSQQFDSALFGTSSSRLIQPEVLNPLFGARFANLAMNDATVYEQFRLFQVFIRAHPAPKVTMLGLDYRWCVTGPDYQRLTFRTFPEWMYRDNPWRGYREMFNLYTVQAAGQLFGIMLGIKKPDQGRDGYTGFVPPDATYDPARALMHLTREGPAIPVGMRAGAPESWTYPAMPVLRAMLTALPPETRKILFFIPYNHRLLPAPGSDGAAVWDACRAHAVAEAATVPNALVVDFMRVTPISSADDNYWDGIHYRTGIADRLAQDLAAASRGHISDDYVVLWPEVPSR